MDGRKYPSSALETSKLQGHHSNEITARKLNSRFYFGAYTQTINSHVEVYMSYLRWICCQKYFHLTTNISDISGCPRLPWDIEVTKKTLHPPQLTYHLGSLPHWSFNGCQSYNLFTFHFPWNHRIHCLLRRLLARDTNKGHQNTHQSFQRGRKLIDCVSVATLLFFSFHCFSFD